ncbi:MAG: thiolase family protein, partial [Chloroflexi bacterium]|nr:thiolase family protein [Chloroflexota bacterium]
MRPNVAIIGAGMIPFGELFDQSFPDMVQEAYISCLKSVDKGIDPKEIKAAWFGQWSGGGMLGQGAMCGSALGSMIGNLEIPITRTENGCPTGSDCFRNAVVGVASGMYDVVLAMGAEKMRDKPGVESLVAAGGGGGSMMGIHPSWMLGVGGPMLGALYATRQLHELNCTMEDFARVAVKNHHNGTFCPYAHYRFEVTVDRVLSSPIVCWPLHLLDCCPQTDGAAGVLLCRADAARKYTDKPVYVMGTNTGLDYPNNWDKPDFREVKATVRAARGAFKMAGIKPDDVDIAEVHDCFSNMELLCVEDVEFCQKGEASRLLRE